MKLYFFDDERPDQLAESAAEILKTAGLAVAVEHFSYDRDIENGENVDRFVQQIQQRHDVSLLFIDYYLRAGKGPTRHGTDAIRRLADQSAQIFVLSSTADVALVNRLGREGINVIAKPLREEDLVPLVRALEAPLEMANPSVMAQSSISLLDLTAAEPFKVKDLLRRMAGDSLLDLSRGDPCDSPGLVADEMFAALFLFAVHVDRTCAGHVANALRDDPKILLKCLADFTNAVPEGTAARLCATVDKLVHLRPLETLEAGLSPEDHRSLILAQIVDGIRGRGYGAERGEEITRQALSEYLGRTVPGLRQCWSDIVLTAGGSECIAVLFKLFSTLGTFGERDPIATVSPVYGPYNDEFEHYQLVKLPLTTTAEEDFAITPRALAEWKDRLAIAENDSGRRCRLLVFVNPSNPSGRAYSRQEIEWLASAIDDREDMFVIEDIVYHDLSPEGFCSMAEFRPDRTLVVGSMSKAFRATGNRFGYLLLPIGANAKATAYLRHAIRQRFGRRDMTALEAFTMAKAPDSAMAFSHTHMVPKVSQWLAVMRLLWADEDVPLFLDQIRDRWRQFHEILGQKPISRAVPYYCLTDFKDAIPERFRNSDAAHSQSQLEPEEFLLGLARRGVVGLPAARFFIGHEREHRWVVRFSVANQPTEGIVQAARIVRQYLADLAGMSDADMRTEKRSIAAAFENVAGR